MIKNRDDCQQSGKLCKIDSSCERFMLVDRSEDDLPATRSLISDEEPAGFSGNWTYTDGVQTLCSCERRSKTFHCNDGPSGSCSATEECSATHSFDKAYIEDGR